jgi:E3 ubiquitin-protein ligase RGLG
MGCANSTTSKTGNAHNSRFEAIHDQYETIAQVQQALRESGLESSDIILAIDLTKSNEWSGADSFNGALAS